MFCSEGLPISDRTKEVIFFHRMNSSRNSVVMTGKFQITNVLGELHLFFFFLQVAKVGVDCFAVTLTDCQGIILSANVHHW